MTAQKSELLATIRADIPLVELCERLNMPLITSRSETKAICPFHPDKNPSLVLYDRAGFRHFHCFSCNAHGDAIHLVKQVLQTDFIGALEWLRHTFALRADRVQTTGRSARRPQADQALSALEVVQQAYMKPPRAEQVAAFAEARNIQRDLLDRAGVGFADKNRLTAHIKSAVEDPVEQRFYEGLLEDSKLLTPVRVRAGGEELELDLNFKLSYQEFFRDPRIVFPIKDTAGVLAGFAGRLIGNAAGPKYLYTPGLRRSRLLYRGENVSRYLHSRAADPTGHPTHLYVTEGLLDALRLESLDLLSVSILGAHPSHEQIGILSGWAKACEGYGGLVVRIFLDRDRAGIRGAAKLARSLSHAGIPTEYIFPTEQQLDEAAVPSDKRKDPDEILAGMDKERITATIENWVHASALSILADWLEVSPELIVSGDSWHRISGSQRHRVFNRLLTENATVLDLLAPYTEEGSAAWLFELRRAADQIEPQRSSVSKRTDEDDLALLSRVRTLAWSGACRGELPADEASWRRLDIAANAFNEGLFARLASPDFRPLEPFDAVWVSRGFGKDESRLKTMPCVEDLVAQQYVLCELLTEKYDASPGSLSFSNCIPAVRFYGEAESLQTTAPGGKPGRKFSAVSFAYQIDMDVLEGRRPPSDQGMFRPYIQCWRDFIRHLRRAALPMSTVHVVRLDLKRFYDRLRYGDVRNVLRSCIGEALKRAEGIAPWAKKLLPDEDPPLRGDKVTDWLCEQSFGYRYYKPTDGSIQSMDSSRGIPQGPVLSAWLANIALFPFDEEVSAAVERLNVDAEGSAAFARYVDDVFLIADSAERLEILRSVAASAARRLDLELLQKGDLFRPMEPHEFADAIVEGRAPVGYGPAVEPPLFEIGDGVTGGMSWAEADVTRASALDLLGDQRSYRLPPNELHARLFTAVQARDLRPSELHKVSRWIWYSIADDAAQVAAGETAWTCFWTLWSQITRECKWQLKPAIRPWEDPLFIAIEGIDLLFSTAHSYIRWLTPGDASELARRTKGLADLVTEGGFFDSFTTGAASHLHVGKGVAQLARMHFQRCAGVRWKAAKLSGRAAGGHLRPPAEPSSSSLASSSVRSLLCVAETNATPADYAAFTGGQGYENDPLREALIWLHAAVVTLRADHTEGDDRLRLLQGRLHELKGPSVNSEYARRLKELLAVNRLLCPDDPSLVNFTPSVSEKSTALSVLVSTLRTGELVQCLRLRRQLLGDALASHVPLPEPPGLLDEAVLLVSTEADFVVGDLRSVSLLRPKGLDDERRTTGLPLVEGDQPQLVQLTWSLMQLPEELAALELERANWELPSRTIFRTPPQRPTMIDAGVLQWAAATFRALTSLSGMAFVTNEDGVTEQAEYVATWPHVVLDGTDRSISSKDNFRIALLCRKLPRSRLGSLGFVRGSGAALRTIEVPSEFSWLWRIGCCLTDLLGYGEELDRYTSISARQTSSSREPAEILLKQILRRLRGDFAAADSGRTSDQAELPPSVTRSLRLLEGFPVAGEKLPQLAYVLFVDAETRAMELRLTAPFGKQAGFEAYFLSHVATETLIRSPLRDHLAELPELSASPSDRERRCTAALSYWYGAVDALNTKLDEANRSPEASRAGISLVAGLRIAAFVASVRAIVLENALDRQRPIPTLALPPQWGWEDVALLLPKTHLQIAGEEDRAEESIQMLDTLYRSIVERNERGLDSLDQITPPGWLVLLANSLSIYEPTSPSREVEEIQAMLDQVALALALVESSPTRDTWPFDYAADLAKLWTEDGIGATASRLVDRLDVLLGLKVIVVSSSKWQYNPSRRSFIDASGEDWNFPGWAVHQLPYERHVEQYSDGHRSFRVWSETRNKEGRLVGVSALGYRFGSGNVGWKPTLFQDPTVAVEAAAEALSRISIASHAVPVSSSPTLAGPSATGEAGESNLSMFSSADAAPPSGQRPPLPSPVPPSDEETAVLLGDRGQMDAQISSWRILQRSSWAQRESKASGHIRAALFQFRIDESYSHPLESEVPEFVRLARDFGYSLPAPIEWSAENDLVTDLRAAFAASQGPLSARAAWTRSSLLPSWAELRRRSLLTRALEACQSLKVDLLVLPEYSVRPDTVAWLRNHLESRSDMPAILAGTYRIHGDVGEMHYKELYDSILGKKERELTVSNRAQSLEQEKSAILTLIQPLETLPIGIQKRVQIFTRRKKYASVAMGELINAAGSEPWLPLFTATAAIEALMPEIQMLPAATVAEAVRRLTQGGWAAQFCAELICSELFVTTSPANWLAIQGQYGASLDRFGGRPNQDELFNDLRAIAEHLAYEDLSRDGGRAGRRRTILLVPACTSRTADYWIHGQASLLAAGITTIFCSAVGKDCTGGSCFLGGDSWKVSKAHGVPDTPYGGWSRGVFYGAADDCLGRDEQALVVADIDPIYMNEGKPRPQALPKPLKLVAHLPVLETLDEARLDQAFRTVGLERTTMRQAPGRDEFLGAKRRTALIGAVSALHQSLASLPKGTLLAPTDGGPDTIEAAARTLPGLATSETYTGRLSAWTRNWRQVPVYGPPPAIVDWLWVDHSLSDFPHVFTPSWTGDTSTGPSSFTGGLDPSEPATKTTDGTLRTLTESEYMRDVVAAEPQRTASAPVTTSEDGSQGTVNRLK